MNKQELIASFGTVLIRLLSATWRIKEEDRSGYLSGALKPPFLVALWHNRLMGTPLYYRIRFCHQPRVVVLTSASRDGGLLAAFMKRFGMDAVRGSSSRRGATALLELIDELERGTVAAITPDGPRGPKYRANPGIIFLSQKAQVPILPLQIEFSSYWELKSWDRFRIPKPFAEVTFTLHPFRTIPADANEAALEAERLRLEDALSGREESATASTPPSSP